MFDSKKLTEICIKHQITPNQFYVLYLVFSKERKLLSDYVNNVVLRMDSDGMKITGFDVQHELMPLVTKGCLMNWGNHKFEMHDLALVPTFEETLFIDTEQAGKELFDTYPQWLNINGQRVVAKSCDKDEYMSKYARKIGNSKDKHYKIIQDLNNAKEKDLINFKIANFIDGELWDALADTGQKSTEMFRSI